MNEKLNKKTNVGALSVRNTKKNLPNCAQKGNRGITLVALIITIILLLILAVVAIRAVSNDGIISHAKNAQIKYEKEQANEQTTLEEYLETIESNIPGSITIAEAQDDEMLNKEKNSITYDIYGNKIVIPAGFKILVDDTTGYNETNIDVTKGIVIQDVNGNEFVWVPVGKIYTDEPKTASNSETITLGRYRNNEVVQDAIDYDKVIRVYDYYIENTPQNHEANYNNAIAKNIGDFCKSSIKNKGYYIGRFEAGKLNNNLVCKANQEIYSFVTQNVASSLSKGMYSDGYYSGTFSSDLVNSYAWDTAIKFIQTFGIEDYASSNKCTGRRKTGTNGDKYCNIHDMSGNANEWSTETYSRANTESFSYENYNCVIRGGFWSNGLSGRVSGAMTRSWKMNEPFNDGVWSFRVVLYIAS